LRTDTKYPDKVCVRKLERQGQIDAIKELKAEYYKRRLASGATTTSHEPKKPSAKAALRRKEEKKEQQRMHKEAEQKESEQQAEAQTVARAGINPHGERDGPAQCRFADNLAVKASFPDIQLSTVTEIIHNPALKRKHPSGNVTALPFVNAKYRTRVRVVDFSPGFLEQFTRSMADPDWNTALQGVEPNDRKLDDRWEWAFVLLVEDTNVPAGTTPERLRLFVSGHNAENLLGGLKAAE
jgi:protection-of-telomeres protein 1